MDAVPEAVQVPSEPFIPPPGIKPGQVRDPKTGRLAKAKPVLGTGVVDDLEAMEYVVGHAEDATNQHVYYRRLMEKEPKWFAERLAELQTCRQKTIQVSTNKTPDVVFDGKNPCPTCHRGPEDEPEAEPVEGLIEELLNREVGP